MGYQRGLCTQWSRRDRLTIVIIAVAVAFLVGTTVLLVAANTQTSSISSGFSDSMAVTHYDTVDEATAAAGGDDIVLPVAAVEQTGTARRRGTGISKGTTSPHGRTGVTSGEPSSRRSNHPSSISAVARDSTPNFSKNEAKSSPST
ncbi:hypothetical protein [Haladaptatus sp. W1]|uniref:hypothetical protein n=1 Tax=Haladaptatus sp. W1 TaxID=1897478 RepID=UPI000AB489EA|nr:hypothetical protein [Haladaptatus sp. W1]